jgi:DNA primase
MSELVRFIPDEIINDIQDRSDIIELINSYVPLKQQGGRWKACCPFHDEKTPSFVVSPERKVYHCFGCGASGNIFRFIMAIENVDFPNAAHLLARKYNIVIPEKELTPQEHKQRIQANNQRERYYELHKRVQTWFEEYLWNNPNNKVTQYFNSRNIPTEFAKSFGIGAAPDSWDATLKKATAAGFSVQELLACGLVKQSEKDKSRFYDTFRNRLIFPIYNDQGEVVAFSARTIDPNEKMGKYVNSPATEIFNKSQILYGFSHAKKSIAQQKNAILCEGQLDVIAMHSAGFTHTIAAQGTAFTELHAKKIKRYTNRLYTALDSDKAGINATLKVIKLVIPLDMEVRVIQFPDGTDPDDIIKKDGAPAIQKAIDVAMDGFQFLLHTLSKNLDLNTPVGKNSLFEEVSEFILTLHNKITSNAYKTQLATFLNVNESDIFSMFANKANPKRRHSTPTPQIPDNSVHDNIYDNLPKRVQEAEKELLIYMLLHGTNVKRIMDELPIEMISQSIIGLSIRKVIDNFTNEVWENSVQDLQNKLTETGNPALAAVLLDDEHEKNEKMKKKSGGVEKAIHQSILTLKRYYFEQESLNVQQQIRALQNTKQQIPMELLIRSMEIDREKIKYSF